MKLNPRHSRRAILAGAMGLTTALIARCSGPFSSDSEGDEAEPTAAAASTSPSTNEDGLQPAATPTADRHVTAAASPPAQEVPVSPDPQLEGSFGRPAPAFRPSLPREVHIPYAAVVSPKLQVREISLDDLRLVWSLEINNWRELGDPVTSPVRRYSLPDTPLPIEPFGGDVGVQNYHELTSLLWEDRGGIAIVPERLVDHRVRTLRVDGIDILRGRGAPNPLLLQLFGVPEEIAPEILLPRDPRVRVTFVGDIIFGRYVQVAIERHSDPASPFRSIAGELQRSDITIGNLECTLSDNFDQPEKTDPQTFRFKTWTSTVSGLELADIDVLSRANNHSFDFGPVGMNDTSATLEAAGIKHFGMGQTLQDARQPSICTVGDLTFAFLGYNGVSHVWDGATVDTPGTSPMIEEYVREDVSRAAAAGHIVVPFFHWGVEYVPWPTDEQRRIAHAAIESGAAAVIGSHPHWVQAVETYRGRPIIYSLGNFVFDQAWSRETMEGMIADLWFEGPDVTGVDLRPVLIVDEHRPTMLDEDSAYHVLQRVWDASEGLRDPL